MIRRIDSKQIPRSLRGRKSQIRAIVAKELDALKTTLEGNPLSPYEVAEIVIDLPARHKPAPKNILTALLKETKRYIGEKNFKYKAFSRTDTDGRKAIYVTAA